MVNLTVIWPTPFGPVALIWTGAEGEPKIVRVLLSRPGASAARLAAGLYPEARAGSCPEVEGLAAGIREFLAGGPVAFPLDVAALETRPPFQRSVLRAEHAIPRGRVSAYGLIAARLGNPKAVRAVGRALATNPFPLIVPCHRAVRSDGSLGGFQGGPAMKRALLEMEGVPFDRSGRVAVARFHYS